MSSVLERYVLRLWIGPSQPFTRRCRNQRIVVAIQNGYGRRRNRQRGARHGGYHAQKAGVQILGALPLVEHDFLQLL